MLSTLLKATNAGLIKFVGSTSSSQTAIGPTFSIIGLTGGIDTAPRVGDIVIACVGVHTVNDSTVTEYSGSYTKAAQVRGTGVSNGVVTAVFYKVLSAEETSISIEATSAGSSTTKTFVAHVWRYVDQANPLAATTTTAAGTSGTINPPAITTLVTNSVVVAVGAASYATGVTPQSLTVPDGMQNFESINSGNSSRPRLGVASLEITNATTYDPPSIGGGSGNVDSSSASITIALRPA